MCGCVCARARALGRRGAPGKKKTSRRSNCVKIISPWLKEGSPHGKAILGIKKKKKIFKEGGRKAGQEGAGRSAVLVPPRRHLSFPLPAWGDPLTTHPPASRCIRAPCCPPARTAQPGRRPTGRGGGCKGLAARADLVAGAVVQAVPGSRRSQRAHVTAPALR